MSSVILTIQKIELLVKQRALLQGKDEQLDELQRLCDTDEQWDLIYRLLKKFEYIQYKRYGELINAMGVYIESVIKGDEDKYCILALTKGDDADSAQAVVYELEVPLCQSMAKGLQICNRFDRLEDYAGKHPSKQYILVDEFVGSGRTLISRCEEMKEMGLKMQICMMAGIKDAVSKIRANGFSIHCCYEMPKGISGDEELSDEEIGSSINNMLALEGKLAKKIKKTRLKDHSLGFGGAEALFKIAHHNTPNSIYPIFWWKKYLDKSDRVPLLDRYQNGY